MNLPEGTKSNIVFTLDHDAAAIIAHIVLEQSKTVIAKFAYPAKTGYQTLTVEGRVYTGIIESSYTINKSNEILILEIGEIIGENIKPIGSGYILDSDGEKVRLVDNTIKGLL